MGRPPHARVGVGHRVPHRVDGKGRGDLELGGLFEAWPPRCRGRPTPPRARCEPRWSSSRAYCSQLCRGHESSNSRASCHPLGRGREVAAKDIDPAALQQNTVDVQRLLTSRQCRSACPKRSSASSNASIDKANEAEIQPASRHVMCTVALGYRRIRFMDQALALCAVTGRPARRGPLQLRSGRC